MRWQRPLLLFVATAVLIAAHNPVLESPVHSVQVNFSGQPAHFDASVAEMLSTDFPHRVRAFCDSAEAEAAPEPESKSKSKTEAASRPEPKAPIVDDSTGVANAWIVQVASFSNEGNANKLKERLQAKGYKAYVKAAPTSSGKVLQRVFVGPELKKAVAEQHKAEIEAAFKLKATARHRT